MQHVWFRRYEPLGRAWIAPEAEVDGRRVFHKTDADVRICDPVDEARFAPDATP